MNVRPLSGPELQELTRDTDTFGLRLSMTRAELELALRADGARIVSSEDKAIHASLPNGKEIAAIYTSRGQTREIDIDASGGRGINAGVLIQAAFALQA